MIGFETYDLQAWMSNGLTVHPHVAAGTRPANRSRRSSLTAKLLLPAVAISTLGLYIARPVAQARWLVSEPTRLEQAEMRGDLLPYSPSAYWQTAIAGLKAAPIMEESGPVDPPTRY